MIGRHHKLRVSEEYLRTMLQNSIRILEDTEQHIRGCKVCSNEKTDKLCKKGRALYDAFLEVKARAKYFGVGGQDVQD